jgi:tetratricopeptide (TPR) repeat protein
LTIFKEWNTKILSLSPEEFEELCYDIISSLGYVNLDWRKGGGDKGKDITAEKHELKAGIETITEKWYFQCKRYSSGISVTDISSAIDWAIADKANFLVFMSNSHLTNGCKEFVDQKNKEGKTQILQFTDKKFQSLLFRFPQIISSYFPNEKVPDQNKVGQAHGVFEITLKNPKLAREITEKISKITTLPQKDRINKITKVLKEKIIDSNEIDINTKALLCQQLSVLLYNTENYEEAIKVIDKGLSISPKSVNLLGTKAFFLTKKKKDFEADLCYNKLLKINPNDKHAWNNLGHIRTRQNRNKGAMICYEKAIDIDPNFIIARDNKGTLLKNQYKIEEALKTFDETLDKFPNSKTTLERKADLLRVDKDYKNALLVIEQCLEIDPYFTAAQNTKGVILQHNGKHFEKDEKKYKKFNKLALETFEKVNELDPDYVIGHTNKVVCLTNLNQLEKALKYVDITIDKFPDEEMPWHKKALIFRKMEKMEEAYDCIQKSLEIHPNFKEALIEEALYYFDTGNLKKALKIMIRLSKTFQRDENVWGFTAAIYEGLGILKKAENCNRKFEKYSIPVKSLIE